MKSSCCLDNFDIPFIDDDADSNYELNLKETVTNNNNNNNNTQSVLTSVSATSYENNSLLNFLLNDTKKKYAITYPVKSAEKGQTYLLISNYLKTPLFIPFIKFRTAFLHRTLKPGIN